jgi:hypothetical protein
MCSFAELNPNVETPSATPIVSPAFTAAIFFNDYKYEIRSLELVGRWLRNQYKNKAQ